MQLTVDQALQKAIAAHQEGKLQDAERFYRAILEVQPAHADANHNLGVLAVSVSNPEAALPLFKKALDANSGVEQFWCSYIDCLIKTNSFAEAKIAIDDGKQAGVAESQLALLKQELQLVEQGSESSKKLPSSFKEKREQQRKKKRGEKQVVEGRSPSQQQIDTLFDHYQANRLPAFEALASSMTEEFPEHHIGWKALAIALKKSGRLSESLAPMRRTAELCPEDAEAHSNLGVTFLELGRLEESEESLQKAVALKPDYAEAHFNLGNTLRRTGQLTLAERSYRRALSLKTGYFKAHCNLGVTLQALGDLEGAESNLRQAILLEPQFAEAHRTLATLVKYDAPNEHFMQMKRMHCSTDISEDHRCHLSFALAKASEDLGDIASAFKYYEDGNAIRKKQLKYDVEEDKQLLSKIRASYPSIAAEALDHSISVSNLIPVFIVGMPRSGTTLVEQIISSHSLATGAGELPFAAQFGLSLATGGTTPDVASLHTFRERYLEKLLAVSDGSGLVTDKMPQNFRFLGLLATALPEAKFVHVRRNSAAVCWANYRQYFSETGQDYSYSLTDTVEFYRCYVETMHFWRATIGDRIFDLDYEALTVSQESETRKLLDYLNLKWEAECLAPHKNSRSVSTASSAQVRQPIYQGSSKNWEKYRSFLNGALDNLAAL